MIKILLKQKLREKKIIEKKISKAYKSNNTFAVHVLYYDLILIEKEIEKLKINKIE